jgi:hypothetical protein
MSERKLYAWVTLMHDGKWTLVGLFDEVSGHLPMVSHDRATLECMRPVAMEHARVTGQSVQFVEWTGLTVLEQVGRASTKEPT